MLEGGHQQIPFGRGALVGSMVPSASSPGGFVSSREVQDFVGVDIEGDLDHDQLRQSGRGEENGQFLDAEDLGETLLQLVGVL